MSGDESALSSLLRELRDRKVFRAVAFYAVVGWGAIEVADTTFSLLELPPVGPRIVLILVLLGFPFVVAGSWFFEVVPDRGGGDGGPSGRTGSGRLRSPRWAVGGALLGASGVAALGLVAALRPGMIPAMYWDSRVDPGLLVVFPFAQRGLAGAESPDAGVVEWQLTEELSTWSGISIVDRFHAVDALHRQGLEAGGTPSPEVAVDAARGLGAGRLVMGEVAGMGDSLAVRTVVMNAATAEVEVRSSTVAARDPRALRSAFRRVGAELLGLSDRGTVLEPGSTSSLEAARAYVAGRTALERGEAQDARRLLRQAVDADPEYPEANLWLARVRAWSGDPLEAWLENARRAARHDASATPLLDLGSGRFPEACAGFRAAIEEHPDDVTARIGLAECLHRDDAVLPDRSRSSGWRFRSSHHGAAVQYREAMRRARFLTPILYDRMKDVLPDRYEEWRSGTEEGGERSFRAFPELRSDTLAWTPWPLEEIRDSGGISESWAQAVEHGRTMLLGEVRAWAEAYPRSAAAWLAFASALEEQGRITSPGDTLSGALEVSERALREARRPAERLRADLLRFRLSVKSGDTRRAVRIADSILGRSSRPEGDAAAAVAAVAAFRGRTEAASEILVREASSSAHGGVATPLPSSLLADRERFRVYASSGRDPDAVREIEAAIRRSVRSSVAAADEERTLRHLLDDIVAASPVRGPHPLERPDARNGLLRLRWLLHRGDTAEVRATLDRWESERAGRPPGGVAPQQILVETEIRLLLGDTVRARESLGRYLGALPTMSPRSFAAVEDAFALTRGFSLAADLHEAAGEPEEAARWARVAATFRSDR